MEVGEALCAGPSRWLRASSCSFSFSNGGNGPKGALNGESSSMVSEGFKSNFGRGRILVIVDLE